MKIVIDEKMVARNKKLSSIFRWASFIIMLAGLFIVFQPEVVNNPTLTTVVFAIIIVGFLLSSISNFLGSRFGRSPRPDELIDKSLKGLDDRFSIYHYELPIPHLLVGPGGVWSIIPSYVDGEIEFNQKKKIWVRKGGSVLNKFLARETLGRPDKEFATHQKDLDQFIKQNNLNFNLSLNKVVVLMHKNAAVGEQVDSEIQVLPADKLKYKLRKQSKENQLPIEDLNKLKETIEKK